MNFVKEICYSCVNVADNIWNTEDLSKVQHAKKTKLFY